jgi:nitrite reductase/ring-hydroxylating ferredoxin subunit
VEVQGKTIALFHCDGRFYATDNTCLHRGGPLGEGSLSGTIITCPWHGWEFDVTSGVSTMNPAAKVKTFEVAVEGDDLLVLI